MLVLIVFILGIDDVDAIKLNDDVERGRRMDGEITEEEEIREREEEEEEEEREEVRARPPPTLNEVPLAKRLISTVRILHRSVYLFLYFFIIPPCVGAFY